MKCGFVFSLAVTSLYLMGAACAATPGHAVVSLWQEDAISHEFVIASSDNQIAGEILRQPGTMPRTALIMIGGSGVTTREDTRPAAQLFMTADTAIVILDRRGNGLSTGRYERPGTVNSSWLVPAIGQDVADVAVHLRSLGFDRIVVAGSSFGAWIAASATAQGGEIDAFSGLVAGGVSVAVSDAYNQYTEAGETIERALTLARDADQSIGYDPAVDLGQIDRPGLWVLGTEDRSNPSLLDAEVLRSFRDEGKPYTVLLLDGANHEFLNVETGAFDASWLPAFQAFVRGEN